MSDSANDSDVKIEVCWLGKILQMTVTRGLRSACQVSFCQKVPLILEMTVT